MDILKKKFVIAMSFFDGITFICNALSATPLKCISMNNQE